MAGLPVRAAPPEERAWVSLAAAGALALGIGANTTVFTIVNAVLIRGLPFDEDRIMTFWVQWGPWIVRVPARYR